MAEFTQADLGVSGNSSTFVYGMVGPMQTVFTNVEFPYDIKISSMGMPMGCAEGTSSTGVWVPKTGGFYGRYCIWDSSGNLLAQTNVMTQYVYHGFDRNRPYTWGNFLSQPVLKKGVTYRIGFYRAANKNSTSTSFLAWKRNIPEAKKAYFNHNTRVTTADIDRGASSIPAGGWSRLFGAYKESYYLGMFFKVTYAKANSGAKRWNGGSWEDRGILKWDGSAWQNVPLKKWNGGSWDDVN